jgi:hypothetical protein
VILNPGNEYFPDVRPPLTVTTLDPNTTYDWQVRSTKGNDTSSWVSGPSFTTLESPPPPPPKPPAPTGLSATPTATGVTLSWNSSAGATSYLVEISTKSNFPPGQTDQEVTTETTLVISGLSSQTAYYWRVSATNAAGTSGWSTGGFTTLASQVSQKPLAPTGLSATPTETGATLSWDSSVGATSYLVEISTKANFPPGQTDQNATTETTLVISGLSSQTTYFWRVSATNTAGTSGWSTSGFTTLGTQPSQLPAVPTGLNATLTETGVTLSWNSSVGATSYRVEVSTKSNFPPGQTDQDVTTADTSMAIGGLSSQTTYYWRVSATNAAGTSGWSTAGFTTLVTQPSQPPAAPTGLSATLTATGATLSWNRSTGAFSYRAEVSTKLNFPPGQTTSVTTSDTFLTVNGLTDGTTYYWQVGASNGTDSPSWSGVVSFTTTASGVTSVDPVDQTVPAGFRLSQNYPNPFNPSTTIEFSMPKSAHVRINIYNTLGDLVHTLVDENLSPGTHRRQWVASGLTSGVYFYRIQTNGYVETKRLVLLK